MEREIKNIMDNKSNNSSFFFFPIITTIFFRIYDQEREKNEKNLKAIVLLCPLTECSAKKKLSRKPIKM